MFAENAEMFDSNVEDEDDAESIARSYLHLTRFGSEEEIEEQLSEWEDMDLLDKKAEQFKPKLEKLQEKVVQEKLAEQEEVKKYQKQLIKNYFDGVTEALQDKNLNGITINKDEQASIYEDLTANNYVSSRTGQPINYLGKFLEHITWDEPNYKMLAELTLFAKNPEKYREKFSGDAHWMNKNPEAKKRFIENNPNLDGRNSKLATSRGHNIFQTNNPSTWRAEQGIHHWQNGNAPNADGELNKRLVAENRHNFQGPDLNNKRIAEGTHNFVGSDSNLKRLAEGRHPSQQKKTCEHCSKDISVGMYTRWHGDNCKFNMKDYADRN
jgi:hypothetical protein